MKSIAILLVCCFALPTKVAAQLPPEFVEDFDFAQDMAFLEYAMHPCELRFEPTAKERRFREYHDALDGVQSQSQAIYETLMDHAALLYEWELTQMDLSTYCRIAKLTIEVNFPDLQVCSVVLGEYCH